MAVRHQPELRADPLTAAPERPVLLGASPAATGSRRSGRAWVVPVLVLTVLALVLVAAALGGRSWWLAPDASVETRPAADAPAPAPGGAPAALAVSVRAPATVVAGQPARFVVTYNDGEGIFSGSVEDWGDVGVGSVSQATCAASPPTAATLRGSYVTTHAWHDAGSYPVLFAVTTYVCSNGLATQETRTARLTVVVDPR